MAPPTAAPPQLALSVSQVADRLGVSIGTGRWLSQWSLEGDGATGVAIMLYFLLGGVLFNLLAARAPAAAAPTRS